MGDSLAIVSKQNCGLPCDAAPTKATPCIRYGCQLTSKKTTLLVGLLMGLTAGPTLALADDNYAAIAFSQNSGGHGWSNDYSTRRGAEREALRACGNADCTVVQWVKNACGALATGDGNGYGTGWASGRYRAEEIAMSNCTDRTRNCSIARWVCTTR